ncbi:MAG: ABC transporter permease [Chloroflexota bacterium]
MKALRGFFDYVKRNPALGIGLVILLGLLLFTTVGRMFIDPEAAYKQTASFNQPPSPEHPFGTDAQGRDLLSMMVIGVGLTMTVGAIAGLIGLSVGIVLGFVAGYYGGLLDTIITSLIDIYMTIPSFLILILIATTFSKVQLGIIEMGLIVAVVSWAGPARAIRAQVLSMRERPFVMMAKLGGMGSLEIVMKELVPNLLPFLVMSLSQAVYGGIMASLGLEALGIGSRREPTMGMTMFYVNYYSAFLLGLWWWILEPVAVIVLTLTSLVLVSIGLDEIANPRARRAL